MKAICEKGLDHDSSQAGATEDYAAQILAALGHGPTLILLAESPGAIVNGSVSIAFCDTRTLGEDVVDFSDGSYGVNNGRECRELFQ